MAFGDWLDAQLTRRGLTQSQLARETGRSTAAVNRWVKNLDIPTLENLRATRGGGAGDDTVAGGTENRRRRP